MENRETEEQMKERLRKEIMAEMQNNNQTATNLDADKDKMRKDILDELNGSNSSNVVMNDAQIFGQKQKSKVDFSRVKEQPKEVVEEPIVINFKQSKVLLCVCIVLLACGILLIPKINKYTDELKNKQKKVEVEEVKKEEKKVEKITLKSKEVENLKYPVMHNDSTNKVTYYSKDKINVSSFSNNDILYNAFIDIYTGHFVSYNGAYAGAHCNSKKVEFNARYMKLRINNMFSKDVNYKLTNFTVPSTNKSSSYTGLWKYDSKRDTYVYYGDCDKKSSTVEYLDIKVPYDANGNKTNSEIYVYNYVAFAVVNKTTKAYNLYSDAAYTNKIDSGVLTTNNYEKELTGILNNKKESVSKYKYTFSVVNCAFNDYCFFSGEWVK